MKTWMTGMFTLRRLTLLFATAAAILLTPARFAAQFDLCGCAGLPGLQPFDSTNTATFPAGTSDDGNTIVLPLPPDGVLKFSSFRVIARNVAFRSNASNTPVTLLASGDVTIASGFCCFAFSVSGGSGLGGTSTTAGVGGAGGNGGFRGGDGAALAINGAAIGGAGFGPGGGAGATVSPLTHGTGGTFIGLPELLPLLGGSGGGGGASNNATTPSCTGGGGGGGAGGLLIAANGTLTIQHYQLFADGGSGAGPGNGNCGSTGGGGAGGAIRLVANRFSAAGVANILARGGGGGTDGGDGRIRLETIDPSAQTVFSTTPAAQRIVGPTPITNPISPTIAISSVNGNAVPAVPQGRFGGIDIVLPSPGATTLVINTTGVPGGTTVEVTIKPRVGAAPVQQIVPLGNCTTAGACESVATFNLAAGAYVAEARATFQIQ
jgi:hypothetical protein